MDKSPSVMRDRLKDPRFRNWVASVLMLDVAKVELQKFTKRQMNDFWLQIWRKDPPGPLCDGCKPKLPTRCKGENCPVSKVKRNIDNYYRQGVPTYENTDVRKCLTDYWSVAKCYMPKGHKEDTAAEDTDFSDFVNVVIQYTGCACDIVSKHNPANPRSIFYRAKEVRNNTMHASPMEITHNCLRENKDIIVKMLKSLLRTTANDAIEYIKKLRPDDMSEADAVFALKQSLEALTKFKRDLTISIPKIKADLEKMDANGTSSIDEMETTSTAVKQTTNEQDEQGPMAKRRKRETIT